MGRIGSLLAACCMLSACATLTDSQYRAWSAGYTGCLPEEVTLERHSTVVFGGQGITWVAECRGVRYVCNDKQCTEQKPPTAASATP